MPEVNKGSPGASHQDARAVDALQKATELYGRYLSISRVTEVVRRQRAVTQGDFQAWNWDLPVGLTLRSSD